MSGEYGFGRADPREHLPCGHRAGPTDSLFRTSRLVFSTWANVETELLGLPRSPSAFAAAFAGEYVSVSTRPDFSPAPQIPHPNYSILCYRPRNFHGNRQSHGLRRSGASWEAGSSL